MPNKLSKVRWQVSDLSDELTETLKAIPGVTVRSGGTVLATEDCAFAVQNLLGRQGIAQTNVRSGKFTIQSDKLFAWQREGAVALASEQVRGLIWACGLGKTSTLLAAADARNEQRVLIVTRSIGRDVFARDTAWVCPNREIAIIVGEGGAVDAARRANKRLGDLRKGGSRCRATASVAEATDAWAVVIPWEVLTAHLEPLLAETWSLIIFDEHHLGKGRTAHRTKAAHELSKQARLVWSSTATPVRDRLRDLWAQLYAIAPDAWGSSWKFAHRYCDAKPGRWGGLDSTGTSNLDELKTRLGYFWDVRTRAQIVHMLPAKQRNMIRIPSDSAAKAWTKVDYVHSGIEHAIAVAAESKLSAVIERATDALLGGEKVVLVGNRRAWVPKAAKLVQEQIAKVRAVNERLWLRAVTGEDEVSARQAIAREFVAQNAPALLIATSDSISESIDLQDADRLIVAALPYTPGQLIQLEGRVHRIGQKRPVTIDYYIAEGTIDEHIEDSLLSKLASMESAGADTEDSTLSSGFARAESDIIAGLEAWLAEKAA